MRPIPLYMEGGPTLSSKRGLELHQYGWSYIDGQELGLSPRHPNAPGLEGGRVGSHCGGITHLQRTFLQKPIRGFRTSGYWRVQNGKKSPLQGEEKGVARRLRKENRIKGLRVVESGETEPLREGGALVPTCMLRLTFRNSSTQQPHLQGRVILRSPPSPDSGGHGFAYHRYFIGLSSTRVRFCKLTLRPPCTSYFFVQFTPHSPRHFLLSSMIILALAPRQPYKNYTTGALVLHCGTLNLGLI